MHLSLSGCSDVCCESYGRVQCNVDEDKPKHLSRFIRIPVFHMCGIGSSELHARFLPSPKRSQTNPLLLVPGSIRGLKATMWSAPASKCGRLREGLAGFV